MNDLIPQPHGGALHPRASARLGLCRGAQPGFGSAVLHPGSEREHAAAGIAERAV